MTENGVTSDGEPLRTMRVKQTCSNLRYRGTLTVALVLILSIGVVPCNAGNVAETEKNRTDYIVGTRAQYASWSVNSTTGHYDCDALQRDLSLTNANTYNFLLWDTTGAQYLDTVACISQLSTSAPALRFWITLIPPSETESGRCSVPADSPITSWNETSLFDQSMGTSGCNDYLGWSVNLGRLSLQFPALVAVNVDDFCPGNIGAPGSNGVFTQGLLSAMLDALHLSPTLNFVPTSYWSTENKADDVFVLKKFPWLPDYVDAFLFYFRNEEQGVGPCNATQCVVPKREGCWYGCLAGSCADSTAVNAMHEAAAFAAAAPHTPLVVGFYAVHESACGTPSNQYIANVLEDVLSAGSSATHGIMVYTMRVPTTDCSDVMADAGCIVRNAFAKYPGLEVNITM